jgi:hypothetical protein
VNAQDGEAAPREYRRFYDELRRSRLNRWHTDEVKNITKHH